MKKPRLRRDSDQLPQGLNEEERAQPHANPANDPDLSPSSGSQQGEQPPDPLIANSTRGKPGNASQLHLILHNLRWQFGHGAHSLAISGLAAIVVLATDLVEPGHMTPWSVFGCLPLYFAGVVISFSVERSQHRKRRAHLPLDVSGGGRFALIVAAIILCSASDPATDGLGGRLAMAALILGSAADGVWIAIVATRRRMGFWRAWRELARRERDAQRHCWHVLIGGNDP